jgi:hypothetical protein
VDKDLALAVRVRTEEPSDELRDAVLIACGWITDGRGVWWRVPGFFATRKPPNPLTSIVGGA